MHYAMLVYLNEAEFSAMPTMEQDRCRNACADWHEELVRTGRSSGALRLHSTGTATTLRDYEGKLVLHDGPFAETKEVLGGFVMLDCANLDEAIALARTFPTLKRGFTVELRPVRDGGVRGDAAEVAAEKR